MPPQIIILLGISGSGKGTQAKLLQDKYGIGYVGSGELLRERKAAGGFTGKKIAANIDNGIFVPSIILFRLWFDRWEEYKNEADFKGFVIDGSPRMIKEAEFIDQALDWYEWKEYLRVLLIDVSKEETTRRLSNRFSCLKCGKMYSYIHKPKREGICDACGGELVQRDDDTPEGIKRRISEFEQHTFPVIERYENSGHLIRVNGEQSIEDVHKDILKALGQ